MIEIFYLKIGKHFFRKFRNVELKEIQHSLNFIKVQIKLNFNLLFFNFNLEVYLDWLRKLEKKNAFVSRLSKSNNK